MTLVETIARAEPLQQGDILSGLELYFSALGGSVSPVDGEIGLVLSRNCKAVRSGFIIVAVVAPYQTDNFRKISSNTPEGKSPSLDVMRRRFDAIRDGQGQPDQFYLGTLPGQGNLRFAAKLDSVHTIQLPDVSPERESWLSERRIARLSNDHRRSLQTRFFDSIAHEGFDDFRWWCDQDLEMLTTVGNQQLIEIEAQITHIKLELLTLEGLGSEQDTNKSKGFQKKLQSLEKEKETKHREIEPYLQEQQRRNNEATTHTQE